MPLAIFTSTNTDGTMKTIDNDRETAHSNRVAYLEKVGIPPGATTLHTLGYDSDNFCRYQELSDTDKGDGIIRDSTINADAVVVTLPGHAILLPLADCIGAVIHDPHKNILMVSHLGRHNLEQYGGTKCIDFLTDKHGADPANLTVWLSPAAGKDSYPLYAFDNRGMHEVAVEQLVAAGIRSHNLEISPVDVTTDRRYFSHSQFLKGTRETDGRFAIVAMMR